jgi:hypothetical protein
MDQEAINDAIKRKALPTGFRCTCGIIQHYHPYVYAHWQTPLVFKCKDCNSEYEVLRGKARLVRKS